jgi:CCR4-NOT transcription complex subunit 9
MLPSNHIFSHQHQYPQADASWTHHQQSHHQQQYAHQANHQHAQAHAQAQAAAVAQQQHYNRITAANSSNHSHNMSSDHNNNGGSIDSNWTEENRRVLNWVAELMNGNLRETALMELSKKREQVPELALIIWHSFGSILDSWFEARTTNRST